MPVRKMELQGISSNQLIADQQEAPLVVGYLRLDDATGGIRFSLAAGAGTTSAQELHIQIALFPIAPRYGQLVSNNDDVLDCQHESIPERLLSCEVPAAAGP